LIHFAENGLLISGKLIAGAVARSGTESSNPALSSAESIANLPHPAARYGDPAWWAQRKEEILEPALEIVDPHHHLWDRGGHR
jgi:hypothetical protein